MNIQEFYLKNVLEEHKKHPRTFMIPLKKEIDEIKEGMVVRLIFVMNNPQENGCNGERMWVKIKDKKGDNFDGILDNEPYYLKSINCGDEISFKAEHIATIYGGEAKFDEKIFAIITKKALKEKQINWVMKAEELDNERDSGWQLFYGDETEEYLDNPQNAAIISLESVLSFEPLLENVFGSDHYAFEYSEEENAFVQVNY